MLDFQGIFCFSVHFGHPLTNIHRIPEAKEPVPLPDRLPVGGQDVLPACKGGDQHHKGALRQVKIGDQRVYALKCIAWGNKDVCPAAERFQFPAG